MSAYKLTLWLDCHGKFSDSAYNDACDAVERACHAIGAAVTDGSVELLDDEVES